MIILMTKKEKDKLKKKTIEKWAPIIDSLNLSADKKTWLEEYSNLHQQTFSHLGIPQQYLGSGLTDEQMLPVSIRIAAQTIGLDLVAVKPIGTKPGKSDKQKLRESRINKIRQLEGEEPNVVLPDDIEVYDSPLGKLHYMNFVYPPSPPPVEIIDLDLNDLSGNTQNNI